MAPDTERQFVTPGQDVGSSSQYEIKGSGLYTRGGRIHASLTGQVVKKSDKIWMEPTRAPVVVPQKGKIVLCRVVSVGYAMAKVRILSIDDTPLREELHGIIRQEEIRAAEKDTVSVSNSYRPRDIVRARILSLGDIQAYSLTTAENELGVVLAKSSHDGHMIPISWCEMQCTVTGVKEKRKVAKVTDSVMV